MTPPWFGELPDGWRAVPLKRVASLVTGGTPPKSEEAFYKDGTIPWVKPDDLGVLVPVADSKEKLTDEGSRLVSLVPPDTALVCCIGSVGKMGIAGCALATNQGD